MTLFFKIDGMERLFLLYASELLMRDESTKLKKSAPIFTIPKEFKNIGSGQTTNVMGSAKVEDHNDKKEYSYCSRCHLLFGKNNIKLLYSWYSVKQAIEYSV